MRQALRMCISIIWGMMAMTEWKRIISDRKRRMALICIPLVCFALFFYQKWADAMLADPQEYRTLVEEWWDAAPEDIIDALSNSWGLSENEMRLLRQAEHLVDYPEYLDRVQEQAYKMQHSSIFGSDPNSYVYRNIMKTARDFADCSPDGIRLGNDRAIRDWLDFAWADWGFFAAILLLVIAFQEERQKGLIAIIRTCPGGQGQLQAQRLLILLLYSAGMTILLYYLPLMISLYAEGGWKDLSRPVQSLPEFQRCTLQISISGFLLRYFFTKTACGFLLGSLIWVLLSFLEQVQLCWMMTAAGLAIEYLLYRFIPVQSLLSPLRHINIFSYVFTTDLLTDYANINFFSFPVGKRTLLMGLLLTVSVVLGSVTVFLLPKRYPFGNRDRLSKWLHRWNRAGDRMRRRMGLYGFEWYKLIFLTAGGLFLILGVLFSLDLTINSGAYNRLEDDLYRQYVAQVQGPVTQSTYDYINEARADLENSEMDASEFEEALFRLEQTIAGLKDGAWIVDDTMFMNIYGNGAWYTQRNTALIALLILTACLASLFSTEQSGDLRRVLRSTPAGRDRLFRAKYAVALGVTVLVWVMVFVQEWHHASKLLGETVLAAPCNSIVVLAGFPGTVGTFLALLCLSKGVALLIPMHLCIYIGERCGEFEKTFLISGVSFLIPAAAYRFGAHTLKIATPLTFLSDGNLLMSDGCGIGLFAVWMVLSLLALLSAKRHWCT